MVNAAVIVPCTMWSLALFRSVCSRRCQDRGCLCSYSARPSRSTSSWSWSRDPCRSLPPWATWTLSYSTWSSYKTHQTNTVNKPHRNRQRFKHSLFHGDQRERGISRSHYDSESLKWVCKRSVKSVCCVFTSFSAIVPLLVLGSGHLRSAETRAGHFSALLERRSQRTPLTATIEFIGKQLPEQKKQHNAERTESADSKNSERRLRDRQNEN